MENYNYNDCFKIYVRLNSREQLFRNRIIKCKKVEESKELNLILEILDSRMLKFLNEIESLWALIGNANWKIELKVIVYVYCS